MSSARGPTRGLVASPAARAPAPRSRPLGARGVGAWGVVALVCAVSAGVGCGAQGSPAAPGELPEPLPAEVTEQAPDLSDDDTATEETREDGGDDAGEDGSPPDLAAPDAPSVEPDAADAAESGETADPDTSPPPPPGGCGPAVGDGWIAVAEASGAVRLSDGRLLVVADSGHGGAALLVDPTRPAEGVAVTLPLDGPTHPETGHPTDDDLEGLDLLPDGRVVALTSAGWVRTFSQDGDAFTAAGPSAPISADPRFSCESRAVNCGPNYEGLCFRPVRVEGRCDGYAASKASGELVCLVVASDGAITVDPTRVLPTAVPKDELSDCAFVPGLRADGSGELLLAGNLYSGSAVWRFDEATGEAIRTGVVGAGNQEAIVHLGDARWWSLGDLQGLSPESPFQAFDCP